MKLTHQVHDKKQLNDMAYSRLVLTDNGRVITDQELAALLTAEGFTLPTVPAVTLMPPFPRPTSNYFTPEGRAEWDAWTVARNAAYAKYLAELAAKTAAMTVLQTVLMEKFQLASWVVIGQNPNGTRLWGWVVTGLQPVTLYKSWAMTLARGGDQIYTICFTRK